MTKRLPLLIFLSILCLASKAQEIRVTGFEMRNDVVQIYYYADVPRGLKLTHFKVYANINGQNQLLNNLSGDIGVITTSGNKTITWDCFKDLDTDDISGNIFFTIDCTPVGLSSRLSNPSAFNMYFEYVYSPSVPITFGMGFGGRFGAYFRVGGNAAGGSKQAMMWAAGAYLVTLKWLNLNFGYNELRANENTIYPGYEVGATVLFTRKKWIGVNFGYIGSFQKAQYGEFYVGLTFNWNTGL